MIFNFVKQRHPEYMIIVADITTTLFFWSLANWFRHRNTREL